jgi:ABC-2 type transport system ATP-binding protein
MKQKVLIASTLLHEPRIAFLDEPTSRLDPSASALVKELILVLSEQTKTTFFISTHMTSFAQDIADVIGILQEGKLVVAGPPEAVIEAAGVRSLEDAYLKIVGGKVDREALLAWR